MVEIGKIKMCPMTQKECLRAECEWFTELVYGKQVVGRCSKAWIPILMIELRVSMDKLISGGCNGKNADRGTNPQTKERVS